MPEQTELLRRYDALKKEIASLNPSARFLAVSKKQPDWKVDALVKHGHKDFGENHLTELKSRVEVYTTARWTYLGQVQSGHWRGLRQLHVRVASVDSDQIVGLAEKNPPDKPLHCLIQVCVEKQVGRGGATPAEALVLAKKIVSCPHFRLDGLMFMPLAERTLTERARQFDEVASFFRDLKKNFHGHAELSTLSMGMSDDYREALAHGSTEVRIGTTLFGEREP
jgi:pyridoxal phosphate enzyme (YggS family)